MAGIGLTRLRVDLGPIGRTLALGRGDDRVSGGAGRDQLHGGAGDDALSGGGGEDVLIDGPGRDVLTGRAGADVYVFLRDGQSDRITNFEIGTDRIDLSGWGRIYPVDALEIARRPGGGRISSRGGAATTGCWASPWTRSSTPPRGGCSGSTRRRWGASPTCRD
ncbi:M10 family metallopeptidase C-terminal domain-containing protein [Roseivivax sp. CAU 1761]